MKILLISDIHHGDDRNYKHILGENYINTFGKALIKNLDKIKNIINTENIDLVVNLGDLISEYKDNKKDIRLYIDSLSMLNSLGIPLYSVAGNHDTDSEMSREIFMNINTLNKSYYSFEFKGYKHIILDGNRDGKIDGEVVMGQKYRFDINQIDWLENELELTNKKCLIYCHYPIDDQDISNNINFPSGDTDRVFPQNYKKVREIIENSGKVLGFFSGHVHFESIREINGIIHKTVGSFSENNGYGEPKSIVTIVDLTNGNFNIKDINI